MMVENYEPGLRREHQIDHILWSLGMARRYLRIAIDEASEQDYDGDYLLDRFIRKDIVQAMVNLDDAVGNIHDRSY